MTVVLCYNLTHQARRGRIFIDKLHFFFMTPEAAVLIAKGMTILAMVGTAIGQGYLVGKTMEAIGRNPDVQGSLFSKMIIGVAMTETTAIFALVAFFLLG